MRLSASLKEHDEKGNEHEKNGADGQSHPRRCQDDLIALRSILPPAQNHQSKSCSVKPSFVKGNYENHENDEM